MVQVRSVTDAVPVSRRVDLTRSLALWTCSSAHPRYGVDALCDDQTNSFWQSDGNPPHTVRIHFSAEHFVTVRPSPSPSPHVAVPSPWSSSLTGLLQPNLMMGAYERHQSLGSDVFYFFSKG